MHAVESAPSAHTWFLLGFSIDMSVVQHNWCVLTVGLLVASFAGSARADLRVVTDVASADLAGDNYNSFRASDISGRASDRTLAWFDLDGLNTSTWNSLDHSLSLYVNVYSDRNLTEVIGLAYASGTVRPGDTALEAAAHEYFDLVAESITWSVQLDGNSSFDSFLRRQFGDQPADGWSIAIGERVLGSSIQDTFSGKTEGPRGGLAYDRTQRLGDDSGQVSFHTDMMLKMESAAVPLPGSVLLALFGFAGLALRQRFSHA